MTQLTTIGETSPEGDDATTQSSRITRILIHVEYTEFKSRDRLVVNWTDSFQPILHGI